MSNKRTDRQQRRIAGYPHNWSALRLIRLRAAGYACEESRCGVRHYTQGWRHFDGTFTAGAADDHQPGARFVRICLALTHLDDPTPSNCKASNLRIRCQRCHNIADCLLRAQHARDRRMSGRAIRDLFA